MDKRRNNWKRAIEVSKRLLAEEVEIYEVMRIFTPMSSGARKRFLLCDIDITEKDLDEVDRAISGYKKTLEEISSTRIEKRVKRSMFFQTLKEHYDKNKV
ncbi:MAG: hypothetical protein EBR82_57380 [Caulobacteraceae bacterium]|jgi:predicted nuclease with RNAse H fold|nr:hypothetical protein [Caulobacteraceae bacterium]